MYNRGDYILFSMRARIADVIHDPVYGESYIVECENHGNSVIRVSADNVDIRYVPTVQRQFPGQRPSPARRRSSNAVYLNGARQGGMAAAQWTEHDVMSPQNSPRRNTRALEYGSPEFPEWAYDENIEQKG